MSANPSNINATQVSRPQTKIKLPLPSLDQLVARLSPIAPPSSAVSTPGGLFSGNNSNAASSRSNRLPATLLARTTAAGLGQSSNNSEISLADSTRANPPSTDDNRSVSPSLSSTSAQEDPDIAKDPGASAGLTMPSGVTSEQLELHDKATADMVISPTSALSDDLSPSSDRPSGTSSSKQVRGYKNIPSLDDITKRLHKTRLLSVDGTDAPPPVPQTQPSEQNQQNRASAPGAAPHPLQNKWIIYHDTKAKQGPYDPSVPYVPPSTETGVYEANLTFIGEFDTVEGFCRYFNWLKPPSSLERNSNYHLFKSGIKPMWEDSANADGGKWVLTMKSNPQLLDRCWTWLVCALVGEELDDTQDTDEICGAVVSLRSKVDRIQVWTRSKDVERVNRIGKRLIKLLDVDEKDGIGLDFQFHQDERPTPSKYLSIQLPLPTSGFRSSFTGVPYVGGGVNPINPVNPYGGIQPNAFGGIPGGAFGSFTPPLNAAASNGVVSGGVSLGLPPRTGFNTFGAGNPNFGGAANWRNSAGSGGGGTRRQQ